MTRVHPTLLAEMRLALLSEFGAEAAYGLLARRAADEEMREVFGRMEDEERVQIGRLRALMQELGARPQRRSLRRRFAARLLVASSRLVGPGFTLRICREAEDTVGRWYREYANHLVRVGELDAARTCEELRIVKERHSLLLGAWISNAAV